MNIFKNQAEVGHDSGDGHHSPKDFWHIRKSIDIVYIAIIISMAAMGWAYSISVRLSSDEARSAQFHQDLNQRLDQMELQLNYLVHVQNKDGGNP